MCNIAGYVGTKSAAPLLIEMMRKQEGLDCGYFTGIATIHEGKIYYAKVVGDVDTLVRTTDASSLPGTIGFIHGRTPGGKNELTADWSHPFTTETDGEVESAFIENGCIRYFNDLRCERIALAEQVKKDGFKLKTELYSPGSSLVLSNDHKVHYCDVLCQLITQKVRNGSDTVTAIADSCCQMPTETVGLFLSKTVPDAITWVRMNYPMHLSFTSHGAYMGTAPTSFPDDAGEVQLLPPFSSGLVYKNKVVIQPFEKTPAPLAPVDSVLLHKAYEIIYAKLHQDGGVTLPELGDLIMPLFSTDGLTQVGAVIYRILYDINKKEALQFETKYRPGKLEGLNAPLFYMSL